MLGANRVSSQAAFGACRGRLQWAQQQGHCKRGPLAHRATQRARLPAKCVEFPGGSDAPSLAAIRARGAEIRRPECAHGDDAPRRCSGAGGSVACAGRGRPPRLLCPMPGICARARLKRRAAARLGAAANHCAQWLAVAPQDQSWWQWLRRTKVCGTSRLCIRTWRR
jgi:hypothetical protein